MWHFEWLEYRVIWAPLKLLQTASRVDTILKRYDKAGATLVDFQEKDRMKVLTDAQLHKLI